MELQKKILEGTLEVFNQKGLKFTMDDLAGHLGTSKKTIYMVFRDKEALFLAMVESGNTLEKIRKILGVLPEGYKDVDFRQLYMLKEKYPRIYEKVEEHLETGWETTIALLEQGMAEGVIRPVRIPILKMMLEASLEQFFQRDVLIRNRISYQEALDEVVNILVDGIQLTRDSQK